MVLVVDDNEEIRRIIEAILRSHGNTVVSVPDGVSALKILTEKTPDVVILDVMMPEMNGLQVLDRLRDIDATRSIPVVMLTALDQDTDLLAGYKSGADYYITKPFTSQQLLYALDLVGGVPGATRSKNAPHEIANTARGASTASRRSV
jgi:CheY-like chemotaxis protein